MNEEAVKCCMKVLQALIDGDDVDIVIKPKRKPKTIWLNEDDTQMHAHTSENSAVASVGIEVRREAVEYKEVMK